MAQITFAKLINNGSKVWYTSSFKKKIKSNEMSSLRWVEIDQF
jgi:hypothetical protein